MNCDLSSLTYIKDCKPFLYWFLQYGGYIIALGFLFILFVIFYVFKKQEVNE